MRTIKIKDIVIGEGKPKVCVPIMGKDEKEIIKSLQQASKYNFDMIEWRIDYLAEVSIENVLKIGKIFKKTENKHILLFTFRSEKEGGEKTITPQEYIDLNRAIIENELCDMIDVEVFMAKGVCRSLCDAAHMKGIYVVGSNHDFTKTPDKENLINRFVYMQFCDVDICKLAMMPNCKEDVYELMIATHTMKEKYASRPLVSMSMGELGKPSRILGELFDSAITFGCVGKASAPGQMEVEELNKALEYVHDQKEDAITKFIQ